MIYSRQQFADMWNEEKPGLGDPDSPLWVPEHNWDEFDDNGGPSRCEWFICVKPIRVVRFKKMYWDWCDTNLQGHCRCFSSNADSLEEWWGFTNEDDIALWMLKWV